MAARFYCLWLGVLLLLGGSHMTLAQPPPETFPVATTTEFLDWSSNSSVLFQINRISVTNSSRTNSPLFRARHMNRVYTNTVFQRFSPDSMSHLVWTNFIAHTNGRELRIWSERVYPRFPTNTLKATWNPNGLMWGLRGLTALSPHCEADLGTGNSPFTALTRRHGYTRGHGMGTEGITTNRIGNKIWFLTTNNVVIEVKVKQSLVRLRSTNPKTPNVDYTIALFDRDLPPSIEPIRVVSLAELKSRYPFHKFRDVPFPVFLTEQGGGLSTLIPPFVMDVVKGGDSGCPNLVPMPAELIFFGGRSTTGPSPEMQADMDALCRLEKLDPRKYQMQWVDLSKYPAY